MTEADQKVLELRKAGATIEAIAGSLGLEADAVAATLHRLLSQPVDGGLEEHHRLELERLDAMQRALWPAALQGKWLAVDRCLAIMDRRSQLLGLAGLEPPQPQEEPDALDDLAARRAARLAAS